MTYHWEQIKYKHCAVDENGCWLWLNTISPNGYGMAALTKRRELGFLE